MIPTPAQAQSASACTFHDWLLQLYVHTEHIADDGIDVLDPRWFTRLSTDLNRFSDTQIGFQLRHADFDGRRGTIRTYIEELEAVRALQHAAPHVLDNFFDRSEHHRRVASMREALANLSCAEDPGWSSGGSTTRGELVPRHDIPGNQWTEDEIPPDRFVMILAVAAISIAVLAALVARAKIYLLKRARRYKCRLPCHVRIGRNSFETTLVDLSRTGCKVTTEAHWPKADACHILATGLNEHCEIAWTTDGALGAQFQEPLAGAKVRALVRGHPN